MSSTVFSLSRCAVVLGALIACHSSDSLGPGADGRIQLTYSGEINGAFDASGRPASATPSVIERGDYAVAVLYDAATTRPGTFSLIANDDVGAPYGNMLLFGQVPAHTGTYRLSNALEGALLLSVTWDESGFGEDKFFSVDNGEIVVTEYSTARVAGTISATATHYDFNPNPIPVGTISIHGQFNVPFDNVVAIKFRCALFAC